MEKAWRKTMTGQVVSDKMDKTITVAITKKTLNPCTRSM